MVGGRLKRTAGSVEVSRRQYAAVGMRRFSSAPYLELYTLGGQY